MLQKDQDIAVARSLTDPLYQLWKFLEFDRKWREKYVPAQLAKQNVGQVSGPDGIKGVLELYYVRRGVEGGVFIRLEYNGDLSLKVAKVIQNNPLKKEEFCDVPVIRFDEYISNL